MILADQQMKIHKLVTVLGTTFQLLVDTRANQSNTRPQLKSLRHTVKTPSEVQTDHQNGEES